MAAIFERFSPLTVVQLAYSRMIVKLELERRLCFGRYIKHPSDDQVQRILVSLALKRAFIIKVLME